QVELAPHARPQPLDVRVLDVPAVHPQVNGDPGGAGVFGDPRRLDGGGIAGLAGLPPRRPVVGVDGELRPVPPSGHQRSISISIRVVSSGSRLISTVPSIGRSVRWTFSPNARFTS